MFFMIVSSQCEAKRVVVVLWVSERTVVEIVVVRGIRGGFEFDVKLAMPRHLKHQKRLPHEYCQ